MRQYKHWTREEDDVLRFLYLHKKLHGKQIAKEMGRSHASIENRLSALNLRNEKSLRWLPAEEDFLRENFSKYRLWFLAKHLGRSKKAISTKADLLNLKAGE